MNGFTSRLLTAAVLCFALNPLHAGAASTRAWHFEVFLDDKPIGFHRFELNGDGDSRHLLSEADFCVKILGLTVYDYKHRSSELWQQDCLTGIDASTDDNGKDFFVRGNAIGDLLSIEHQAGNAHLNGCVMTFAYWNPAILTRQRLLNVQTGEYLDVSIQHLGEQILQLRGHTVAAAHYRISSRERDIDLWYSGDHDWLALRSTTRGGRQLHYRKIPSTSASGSSSSE